MKFFLILLTIYALLLEQSLQSKCSCSETQPTSISEPEFSISKDDEVIDGENCGKQIKLSTFITLSKDFDPKSTFGDKDGIKNKCPKGYKAPDLSQLQEMMSYVPVSKLLSEGVFKENTLYVTNTKPADTTILNYQWQYQAIKIESGELKTVNKMAYTIKPEDKVKCILEFPIQYKLENFVTGISDWDLQKCNKYKVEMIPKNNVINHEFELWSGYKSKENTLELIAQTPKDQDCGYVTLKYTKFGGLKGSVCFTYFTQEYVNTEKTASKLQGETSIEKKEITGVTAKRNTGMHFGPGTAPIAPKPNGGAYILYSTKDDGKLFAIEIDNKGDQIKTYDLQCKGQPYDIIAVEFGLVIMARDEPHFLYVKAFDTTKNEQKWQTTLINNGEKPTSNSQLDQMDFGGAFGTQRMYNPHNGRLQYAKNEVFAVFAHYNNFDDKGGVDGHTGDTSVFLNLQTGQKTGQGFTWGCSHSLLQSTLYDGLKIYTSSLGDAYPQSIQNQKIENFYNGGKASAKGDQLIDPKLIPGTGTGPAAGRLGQLTYFKKDFYVQVHSQHPSTTTLGGKNYSSTEDKLQMMIFDSNFKNLNQYKLKPGANVNNIKSAKYGDNLVIGYTTVQDTPKPPANLLSTSIKNTDAMRMMLVNEKGEILKEFEVAQSSLSAADDWEVLSDGSVIWSFVDSSNKLFIYKLPSLADKQREVLVDYCKAFDRQGKSDDKLAGWAIALIVIFVLGVVIAIGAVSYWHFVYKKKKANQKDGVLKNTNRIHPKSSQNTEKDLEQQPSSLEIDSTSNLKAKLKPTPNKLQPISNPKNKQINNNKSIPQFKKIPVNNNNKNKKK